MREMTINSANGVEWSGVEWTCAEWMDVTLSRNGVNHSMEHVIYVLLRQCTAFHDLGSEADGWVIRLSIE
jgi:hypothetical protein